MISKADKILIGIVSVLIILIILFLIIKNNSSPKQEEIVIGISTILTGELAQGGDNMVKAAQLALEEVPYKNLNIKFAIEDAGCGNGKGLTVATKLIDIDKVQAIIGGTCSDDTMAAAPYINEKKIPYITPVTGGSNIDNAGEYVFRTGNADIQAGIQPAEDLINIFNYKNAALLTEQREYTLDIRDNFKKRFQELGGNILLDELFEPNENDFRTLILKVQEKKPDAILLSSQLGNTGAYFIKQAHELNLNIPIFTTFTTVVNENSYKIAGDAMNGIYFYDPDYDENNPELKEFFKKYKEKYGKDPFIPFHAAATYDTTKMIVEAIKYVGNNGEKIHDWLLQNVKNWKGFMGTYSFDEKGNINIGFALKVVQNGKFIRYEGGK